MYVRITYPKIQCLDDNGIPAAGYEIHTFDAGGSTPANSFKNRTLTTANTNPVILNSRGEADMYTGEPLKLIFTIPGGDTGSPIWTVDYVGEAPDSVFVVAGASDVSSTNNNYAVTVTPAITALTENMMLVMTPDADNAETIVSNTFSGTGINDMTASGPYLGSAAAVFTIEIDGAPGGGGVDTFRWKKDGGSWTSHVVITASKQILIEGVGVTFAEIVGHTGSEVWAIAVKTPARVNLCSLGNLLVYKNKGGSIVALDGGDMIAGYPAQLILNSSLNGWLLVNPATPVFSTPFVSAIRYRKEVTAEYDLLYADQGWLLNCIGTFDVNLLTPPEFANRFVYIANMGTGLITLDAGIYTIYGDGDVVGASTKSLYPGTTVQLSTNGADWQVMTTTNAGLQVNQFTSGTGVSNLTMTGLLPGIKYKMLLSGNLSDAAGVDGSPYLQFSGDTGADYHRAGYESTGGTVTGIGGGGSDSSIGLSLTAPDPTSFFEASVEFSTRKADDTYTIMTSEASYLCSSNITQTVISGIHDYSGALSSVKVSFVGQTFTGKAILYKYNTPI